ESRCRPSRGWGPAGRGVSTREAFMSLQSVNPATGEVLETFNSTSGRELDSMLAKSHAAFLEWRAVPYGARAERMREAARVLRRRQAECARTMTLEMGKPITQGEAEAEKCA